MNGKYISEKRAELGLSARKLSEKIGVHYNTVYRWEENTEKELSKKNIKLVKIGLGGVS